LPEDLPLVKVSYRLIGAAKRPAERKSALDVGPFALGITIATLVYLLLASLMFFESGDSGWACSPIHDQGGPPLVLRPGVWAQFPLELLKVLRELVQVSCDLLVNLLSNVLFPVLPTGNCPDKVVLGHPVLRCLDVVPEDLVQEG